MAEKLDLPPTTYAGYEKDREPKTSTLIKIAQEFNISLDELCGLENPKNITEIKTYSDIFKILLQIQKCEDLLICSHLDKDRFTLFTFDKLIIEFMEEYRTMLELRVKGSISNNIFNEWCTSKLDKYRCVLIKK